MMEFVQLEERMMQAPLTHHGKLMDVPTTSGVYTAWLSGSDQCFYVGRSANLWSRIRAHFSGARGGDQFCLYVYDSYVHAERCASGDQVKTNDVNALTSKWIRSKVAFRWVTLEYNESLRAEAHLRRDWRPTLNTLQASS
jgi:hypothetical protein